MNRCRFIPSMISRTIRTIRPVQLATMSSASSARKLEGKVAVVTASTDGIGYAIARRLGEDGAHVVVSSRKKNNVDQAVSNLTKEGLSVSGIVCHVAKAEDRKALFDHAVSLKGGVDILISNAAVNPFMGRLLDTPEDAWEKILQINVTAAFLLTKEVVPIMEKRGGGSIVYVTSIAGFQPFDALAAYSVSKTALLGLTKAAAVHAVDSNVRINCIAPGIVKTKFSQALWVDEAVGDEVKKSIPLKRFGEPKEIAGVVSFLCSDDAAYITGENIVVAGGMQSRL